MTPKTRNTALEKISAATYSQLFSLWMMLNVICALWYFELATIGSPSAPSQLATMDVGHRLFNSFYFSVITATSLGYGDIIPYGFSKVIAMTQSTLALLIFALFVTKLVSRRQDTTLEEVHRMTSESIFYNIRQGLFLVRKDFDILIHKIGDDKKMHDQDWEILTTAYLQMQNILEEIPNLYNGQGHDLYTIDIKREKLLLEAIHRTVRRLETLLDTFKKHHITHTSDESDTEFKELIKIAGTMLPLWRKRSSTEKLPMFDEVVKMIKKLKRI